VTTSAPDDAVPPEASGSAIVITASDRGAAGDRQDASGAAIEERLTGLGLRVERMVVPDDQARLETTLVAACTRHRLVVTTGGTGLTPRDVTPQATRAVIDYEVPGMAELMRAEGRRHTPLAALSRAIVGVRQGSLIVNLPGSPRGATESLDALLPVLPHALETLRGPFDHGVARAEGRTDLPPTEPAEPPTGGGNAANVANAASAKGRSPRAAD
jgi:molybdenum cofactor synthesis domain-containing protein